MERRVAPHHSHLAVRASSGEGRCAPRRSIAVSYGVRAALLVASRLRLLRTISELLAGGPIASGRGPAPPGSQGCVSLEPAGTASSPVFKTPREDAPGRTKRKGYKHRRI